MRIINYYQTTLGKSHHNSAISRVSKSIDSLAETAQDPILQEELEDTCKRLSYQLGMLFTVLKTDEVKGKTLVDLGCGAREGAVERAAAWHRHRYHPWFCRMLHRLGARAIGIDAYNLDSEPFEHHQLDLLAPNALQFIKDCTVDVVHAYQFFDSPELQKRATRDVWQEHTYALPAAEKALRILQPQIERILKTDGLFVHWEWSNFEITRTRIRAGPIMYSGI